VAFLLPYGRYNNNRQIRKQQARKENGKERFATAFFVSADEKISECPTWLPSSYISFMRNKRT
jgi:hypothetical protein